MNAFSSLIPGILLVLRVSLKFLKLDGSGSLGFKTAPFSPNMMPAMTMIGLVGLGVGVMVDEGEAELAELAKYKAADSNRSAGSADSVLEGRTVLEGGSA